MNRPAISRRKFVQYTACGVGVIAVGVAGFSTTGKVNYSDPAYLYWNKNSRGALENESYVVLCGALAASAHNTQPWFFDISKNQVDVYADLSRNLGKADKDRRMMALSVGCAIENITIAAKQLGITPEVSFQNDRAFDDSGYSARIQLTPGKVTSDQPMFQAIFQRQTTRTPYLNVTPSADFIAQLIALNDFDDIQLHIVTDRAQIDAINTIHRQAVDAFVADDNAYLDSVRWWRYSREELLEKRDGISIYTSAAPKLIKQYFSLGVNKEDMQGEFGRRGEADLMYSLFAATPMWVALTASRPTLTSRLNGGRLLERMYLASARENYRMMPVAYACEQPGFAKQLLTGLQTDDSRELLAVVRMGQAEPMEKSVRRALADIIVANQRNTRVAEL
jgi:hypothetical protein